MEGYDVCIILNMRLLMVNFLKPLKSKLNGQHKNKTKQDRNDGGHGVVSPGNKVLTPDLQVNLKIIKTILEDCNDVVYREFIFAQSEQIKVALIYTDSMVDKEKIANIMKAFTLEIPRSLSDCMIAGNKALDFIMQRGVCQYEFKQATSLEDINFSIISGYAVLLIDGYANALVIEVKGWKSRNIEEPIAEVTVRGPRESFVETLLVNISLIRRRIRDPNLKTKKISLGRVTKTDVAILYIKGLVNEELVREAESRLERIQVDSILESGYIEELIEDNPWSPFPTINHTERPDKGLELNGRTVKNLILRLYYW